MKPVNFTQYLRPDGRKIEEAIYVEDETYDKAQEIIQAGYMFEVEVLRTGQISMTITDPVEEMDLSIVVVSNGPQVPEAVAKLIRLFQPNPKPESDNDQDV